MAKTRFGLAGLLWLGSCFAAQAAVLSTGDVRPTPPVAGGNVAGVLTIGEGSTNGNVFLGSVTVNDGSTLTSADGLIGDRVGSIGTARVTGTGSQWNNSDDLTVGNDSLGELSIEDQGWVSSSDDTTVGFFDDGRGRINIDGEGSVLNIGDVLTIGLSGTGNLTANQRARVVSDDGLLGSLADSLGFASFANGATWRIDKELTVGAIGAGSLWIESGSIVESDIARIANAEAGTGEVVVRDRGSILLARNDLFLGSAGVGRLEVGDRGMVQADDELVIGPFGYVTLDHGTVLASSLTNRGAIAGTGTIIGAVANDTSGSIRAMEDESLLIASPVTNSGRIESLEGSLEFANEVTNASSGSIVGRDAVLRFNGGVTNNGSIGFSAGETDVFGAVTNSAAGSINIDGSAIVTFYDTFEGMGSLTIAPGSSAAFLGTTSFAANSNMTLAGLAVDPLLDELPSLIDPLSVSGTLSTGGLLDLIPSVVDDAITEPSVRGERVTLSLMSTDLLEGQFDQIRYDQEALQSDFLEADARSFRSLAQNHAQPGMFRIITYASNGMDLTNYLAIAGDTDGDGDVDFGDFLSVSNNFGQPGTWLQGDFDGDGQVAFGDFLALSENFGQVSAAAVPEPASGMLLMVGFVGALRLRKRSI